MGTCLGLDGTDQISFLNLNKKIKVELQVFFNKSFMMKNRLILPDLEKYVIFTDVQKQEDLYAITKEEQKRMKEIMTGYNNLVEEVPAELTVKAYRMGLVDNSDPYNNKYDIIAKEPIDFPIHRYYWIFIKIVTKDK